MLRLALRLLYLIVSASTPDLGGHLDPLGLGTNPPAQPDLGSKWDPLG